MSKGVLLTLDTAKKLKDLIRGRDDGMGDTTGQSLRIHTA